MYIRRAESAHIKLMYIEEHCMYCAFIIETWLCIVFQTTAVHTDTNCGSRAYAGGPAHPWHRHDCIMCLKMAEKKMGVI